jgi:hypothetical protein
MITSQQFQEGTHSKVDIKAFCDLYGTSALMVYLNASSLPHQENMLNERLQKMTYEHMRKAVKEGFTTELSDFMPHHIMYINPGVTCETYSLDFPSTYIYHRVRNALSTKKLEAIAWLYDMFVNVPKTKGSMGYMLEDAVTDILPSGGEWKIMSLVLNKPEPKNTHWKNPASMASPSYLCLGYLGCSVSINPMPHPDDMVYNALPVISYFPGDE